MGSGNKATCGNVNVKMNRFTLGDNKNVPMMYCVCIMELVYSH